MNVLNLVKKDLHRHVVSVKLPGETRRRNLYLIEFHAKVNPVEDFKQTYGKDATEARCAEVEKYLGKNERLVTFGVFFDRQGAMVFAFNRDLADIDRGRGLVVYKDPDEVIQALRKQVTEQDGGGFPAPVNAVPLYGLPEPSVSLLIVRYSMPEPDPSKTKE